LYIDTNGYGSKSNNPTYKIKASFEDSNNINNFDLKFGKEDLSFWNVESDTNILTINFDDIIGATRPEKDSLNKFDQENLLRLKPISLNYCPKLTIKSQYCCGTQSNSSEEKMRSLKQTFLFIESESDNDLYNILNNVALFNKVSVTEQPKKRYLAIVNPISGKGKSFKVYADAKKVFDLSYLNVDLMKTTYYKHAYEFVLSMETNRVKIIFSYFSMTV